MVEGMIGAPPISVLLPCYNSALTLAGALQSVVRQTFARWECIVVDDGSEDASPSIAREFARRDGRFRILEIPHSGIVAALNAGLQMCRGAFVARMDADDWMCRSRLEEQEHALRTRVDWDVLGCHVRLFPRHQLRDGRLEYERWLNSMRSAEDVRNGCYVECPLAHPTWMARRRAYLDFGYRDEGWPEDYDLLLRWIRAGLGFGVVSNRLHHWRDSPNRLSRTAQEYSQQRIVACKAAHLRQAFLKQRRDYVLWGFGGTGKALFRQLKELDCAPRCIIEVHPGRLGQRIGGIPVLPPAMLATMKGVPIVVSVAGSQSRGEIRSSLVAMGFEEWRDFVFAA